jgi:glycosyltransferase involved in cell wall biosynthesis
VLRRVSELVPRPLEAERVRPRLTTASPVALPLQHLAPVRTLARRTVSRAVRRRIGRRRPLIVWTYLPLPVVADVADGLGADALVYEWADDASEHLLTQSTAVRRRVARWEDEMLERADLVFVSSAELLHRRGSPNPRTYVVPHGIDRGHGSPGPLPPEVTAMPRPRVGFVGSLSQWIDVELLDGLARARPDWSWILVGPRRIDLGRLTRHPNVLLVGERPHQEIPGFLAACDAALIPYKVAPATSVASPVKLREYLAHGLPVVSVDIPEVQAFSADVEVASGVDGFIEALERAVARGKRTARRRARREWSDVTLEMARHVQDSLSGAA